MDTTVNFIASDGSTVSTEMENKCANKFLLSEPFQMVQILI